MEIRMVLAKEAVKIGKFVDDVSDRELIFMAMDDREEVIGDFDPTEEDLEAIEEMMFSVRLGF